MRPCLVLALLGVVSLSAGASDSASQSVAEASPAEVSEHWVGRFSTAEQGSLPPGWETLAFKKISQHTQYQSLRVDGQTAVCAQAEASASGLIHAVDFDLTQFPWVTWRWKVSNLVNASDLSRKAGDDYPARLYITFKLEPAKLGFFEKLQFETAKLLYGEYPPAAALNYVWATRESVGTMADNAYTSRAKMIVVESGGEHLNQWRSYTRNVLEDYRQAFGGNPPPLAGVAIMTDTDNTGAKAYACYGDIRFLRNSK